jgi:uncharacterized protein with NAD-binding domain and iron-sulfur cluster
MTKVIVLGGGIAGLSAAHELIEKGFEVEVYEKREVLGGKARSVTKPHSGTQGRHDLPGEHGFRFFPGFYQHVTNTMGRIPLGANHYVLENLVVAPEASIAQEQEPFYTILTHLPQTLQDWIEVLKDWFARSQLGISADDAAYYVSRLLDVLTMCDDRRLKELEDIKWWDFVDAANRSIGYRKLLAIGLTRSLVAMPAEIANTRTVSTILIQMLMSLGSQFQTMDRALNGPTTDVWIAPWEAYLRQQGVAIVTLSALDHFNFNGANITGAVINQPGGQKTVQADFYLLAVPVEVAASLFTDAMKAAAPSLANVSQLKTLWMNGIQFYLNRDVQGNHGHIICADSRWALTCISQPQFWGGINLSQYGNGQVSGLISVDISDWFTAGNKTTNKKASECASAAEIMSECWAELVAHFSNSTDPPSSNDFVDWFLDPDIVFPGPGGAPVGNNEPLLVNTVGSWANRPPAVVNGIGNLFLASDYVRTCTNLATMEGANEAARRAVNGILDASQSAARRCDIWPLREPAVFEPFKELDQFLFDHGLPHPGFDALRKTLGV